MADIAIELELPQDQVDALKAALTKFQRSTQRDMYQALRTATVGICKSLRKQTARAPRFMPKRAFRLAQSEPKYIDNGNRRRMVRKQFPPKNDFVFFQPVEYKYTSRRTKRGGLVESWKEQSAASLIRAAQHRFGKIANRGLAKHTWGWFMWRLFNLPIGNDWDNKRVRLSHRHVEGGVVLKREQLPDGSIDMAAPIRCDITIINRLLYIRRALAPGALEQAVAKETKNLAWKAENCAKHAH